MPSLIDLLVHPDRRRPSPPPLLVDLRQVVLAGMGLWVVAIAVTTVLWLAHMVDGEKVATCITGLIMGALFLIWERAHRSSYRAQSQSSQPEPGHPAPEP